MSSPLDFEIPGYDIIESIGRGGMASVYRARQHTFDRNVALKILKPDLMIGFFVGTLFGYVWLKH